MKKFTIPFLSLIVALSMILAACSSPGSSTGTPAVSPSTGAATSQPGETSTTMPGTPSSQTTQPAMTEPAATTPAVTQPAATQPAVTGTQPMETPGSTTGTQAIPSTGVIDPGLVSNLINFQVWNQENQQLGTVKDLILNLDTHKVDYIVLSVGGFLGIGSADIPVPWDAFEVNTSATMSNTSGSNPNSLMLNVSKNTLAQAPQLDLSSMPQIDQSSPGWDAQYQTYWQNQVSASGTLTGTPETTPGTPAATTLPETPAATQMPAVTASPQVTATAGTTTNAGLHGVILASKLANASIQSSDGQELGTISDGVVDLNTGDIQYVVISHTGSGTGTGQPYTPQPATTQSATQPAATQAPSTNMGGTQWTPVPLQALGWDAQNQAFILVIDQQTFNNAPSFAPDQFPDTQQSGWDADIQAYWSNYLPSGQ